MGIDRRFAAKIAERFRNRQTLETCTGGGFTTIELGRVAAHVFTVEIDPAHQAQAKQNVAMAGLLDRVTFVLRDIMLDDTWEALSGIDAAFLDPDWAVTGPDHVHRFRRSSSGDYFSCFVSSQARRKGQVSLCAAIPRAVFASQNMQ
jgi:tRNA A58 N-methylase Trm61